MAKQKSSVKERFRIDEPELFDVVLLNDDETTMDFVVWLLQAIFHKNEFESEEIMWRVHITGKGVAGTYPLDIALSKRDAAHEAAEMEHFPLRLEVEPHKG